MALSEALVEYSNDWSPLLEEATTQTCSEAAISSLPARSLRMELFLLSASTARNTGKEMRLPTNQPMSATGIRISSAISDRISNCWLATASTTFTGVRAKYVQGTTRRVCRAT